MDDIANKILGPVEGEEEGQDAFETISSELLTGMSEKNPKLMAKAMKAFIAMYDAEPHEEFDD